MRRWSVATLVSVIALVLAAPSAAFATADPLVELERTFTDELADPAVGSAAGVYVLDLTERRPLFKWEWDTPRIPASNTKLFTSSATMDRYGTDAVLMTSVMGVGSADANGVFPGNLYLRGGGDPTFGTTAFIANQYEGTGAKIEELADEVEAAGITAVLAPILGDESRFDSVRYVANLSALAFDRMGGVANNPPLFSAQQLTAELAKRGIVVVGRPGTGITPTGATALAAVDSPTIGRLVHIMNKPSDNFFAEMLLKNLSAADGDQGTTLDGTKEAEAFAQSIGAEVDMADGSGLSGLNRMSPRAIVMLLDQLRSHPQFSVFFNSLPIAGVDGTLQTRMVGTVAEDNCNAKTGTLSGVSALSGYCQVDGGHLIAFSILMNEVQGGNEPPRAAQDRMTAAIASYSAAAAARTGADIAVTQSDSPDPVHVARKVTYTITVKNNGPSDASGITFSDSLPRQAGFGTVTSSQGSCTASRQTVSCSIGSLASGDSATISIVVKPTQRGTITNTASAADQSDPDTSNNSSSENTTVLP